MPCIFIFTHTLVSSRRYLDLLVTSRVVHRDCLGRWTPLQSGRARIVRGRLIDTTVKHALLPLYTPPHISNNESKPVEYQSRSEDKRCKHVKTLEARSFFVLPITSLNSNCLPKHIPRPSSLYSTAAPSPILTLRPSCRFSLSFFHRQDAASSSVLFTWPPTPHLRPFPYALSHTSQR